MDTHVAGYINVHEKSSFVYMQSSTTNPKPKVESSHTHVLLPAQENLHVTQEKAGASLALRTIAPVGGAYYVKKLYILLSHQILHII